MPLLFPQHPPIHILGDADFSPLTVPGVLSSALERVRARHPDLALELRDHTAPHLRAADVLECGLNEGWLLACLGRAEALDAVPAADFEAALEALVPPFGPRVLLAEPWALEPPDIALLAPYREAVRRVAERCGAGFVAFQRTLERVLPGTGGVAWGDRFALNPSGCTLLSEELLGALGFTVFEDDDEFDDEDEAALEGVRA